MFIVRKISERDIEHLQRWHLETCTFFLLTMDQICINLFKYTSGFDMPHVRYFMIFPQLSVRLVNKTRKNVKSTEDNKYIIWTTLYVSNIAPTGIPTSCQKW